jgi:signal transduction histidine kinase
MTLKIIQSPKATKTTRTSPEKGILHFSAEARLLQELGERLVAVPEVALVELIKNAYDADAKKCTVSVADNEMTISDDGHGMTFNQFQRFWMTIGTSHKAREEVSPQYARDLTGQKGIGRFAVRFLATKLTVTTTAFDPASDVTTQLVAYFDWVALDAIEGLSDIEVPYVLSIVDAGTPVGTTLLLTDLRHDSAFMYSSPFKTQVLRIISPLQGLDRGNFLKRFKNRIPGSHEDPGFQVVLPGKSDTTITNVAAETLANYAVRLVIRGEAQQITYQVFFAEDEKVHTLVVSTAHAIGHGFHADIRWFPRRKGLLSGKEVNGKAAWSWIYQNSGVAIVDRGFRMRPYGEEDDDWLDIVSDANTNRRAWRTEIAEKYFPISKVARNDPALNPMINLPARHQLVGAVFVASSKSTSTTSIDDLIPSTDREGFLQTAAFAQLKKFVRAGIEYIAHLDRLKGLDEKQQLAVKKTQETKAEFREALRYVEAIPTLTKVERARIVTQYVELAEKIDEVEHYEREARGRLSVMGAMGVLAGFLTHEASRLKTTLQRAASDVTAAAKKEPSLAAVALELQAGVQVWNDQLDYVRTFIDATQKYNAVSFKSKPQIARVVRMFKQFCDDRSILVAVNVDVNAMVPDMPVSTYSGIFLNLFTNALKAVMAHEKSGAPQLIEIRGTSDAKRHILEVLDTGIGVPPSMSKRIFDPLFTTTSRHDNSLGTGMGLGLTLSRQLANEFSGTVDIVQPPDGFSTCFRVSFPLKVKTDA